MALWATYHPGEIRREAFLRRCRGLDRLGVRYSVGVVGLKEHLGEAEAMRRELAPDIYLGITAYERQPSYYDEDDPRRFEAIDPLFPVNDRRHPSLGRPCRPKRSVVSVEGDGTMRRCHLIREPIGNLYEPGFEAALVERPCTNATRGCHNGYVHLEDLGLGPTFGAGLLGRIPARPIWRRDGARA